MDFNVADTVRRDIKVLGTKIRYMVIQSSHYNGNYHGKGKAIRIYTYVFSIMRMHGWLNSKCAGEYRVVNVQDNNNYY